MCLIFLSFGIHPTYPMILAANRDEFYDRPTAPMAFWDDAPHILAGRDLKEQGTWLGITRSGRFAGVTNYRSPGSIQGPMRSRGWLVRRFLEQENRIPTDWLQELETEKHLYNGFNLIVGDQSEAYYVSNQSSRGFVKLEPGLYGLSNAFLQTPWYKVEKGKAALRAILKQSVIHPEDIFRILEDSTRPPDDQLPDTGVGLEWERILSPIFVSSPTYGTRSSSVILTDRSGAISIAERTFVMNNNRIIQSEIRIMELKS